MRKRTIRQYEYGDFLASGISPMAKAPSALLCLALSVGLVQCTSPSRPGLPPNSPFASHAQARTSWLPQGVAVGDVTHNTAHIWLRSESPAEVEVQWSEEFKALTAPEGQEVVLWHTKVVRTDLGRDSTTLVKLDQLLPATSYRYRVRPIVSEGPRAQALTPMRFVSGRFTTAPEPGQHAEVTFVWGSDLGGQGHCRQGNREYGIFDRMREVTPAFAVFLGDLIYGDWVCPSPPNVDGSQFVATTLDQFRQKHRYQREAFTIRRFLSEVPVLVTWDDHEVRNNFAGPHDDLMPIGRRAMLEYWPIPTPLGEPDRLYRRLRYGADLEVFLLDTRQYRSRNSELDGLKKTMLGGEQREWLIESLSRSTATWKVIASSVPLSIPKKGSLLAPGNDTWAKAADGTGFFSELRIIVDAIVKRGIMNVVWLSGDIHFAQVNDYHPNSDSPVHFLEFVCGPLSAGTREAVAPVADLRPTTLFSEGGFFNFGAITVNRHRLVVRIIDRAGKVRFRHEFPAKAES